MLEKGDIVIWNSIDTSIKFEVLENIPMVPSQLYKIRVKQLTTGVRGAIVPETLGLYGFNFTLVKKFDPLSHSHVFKTYVGFTDRYNYCDCGHKEHF